MEEKREHIIAAQRVNSSDSVFAKPPWRILPKQRASQGDALLLLKSKEEILRPWSKKESYLAVNKIGQTIAAIQTPLEKLRAFVLVQADLMKERVDYYSILREEIMELLPLARRMQEQIQEHGLTMMRNILQEGADCQVFAIADVESTAKLLVLLIQEFTTRISSKRPPFLAGWYRMVPGINCKGLQHGCEFMRV